MDAALHANFRGAPVPGLGHPAADFVQGQIIRAAAQVFAQLALGKGTELAFEIANIGVIDIAHDNVGNVVPIDLAPQVIRRPADRVNLATTRREQAFDLNFIQIFAARGAGQQFIQLRHMGRSGGDRRRRREVDAGRPGIGAG